MSFIMWGAIAGMAAGELAADSLRDAEKNKNRRSLPGLMTKFRHAVMPLPKTPEDRAQAVLQELGKLKFKGQEHEEPDYPHIEKLLKAGVAGENADLYKIGADLINANQSDLAKTLLAATPNFPVDHAGGKHGATLLHWAVLRADFGVARHLLDRDADVNARTRDGHTPLDIATRRGFSPTATILSDMLTPYGAAKSESPAAPENAKIEEKWRSDMREQIQDIVELDTSVPAPKTARFSKKPGSTP